jgi:hypothetical protein
MGAHRFTRKQGPDEISSSGPTCFDGTLRSVQDPDIGVRPWGPHLDSSKARALLRARYEE